jgi:hypothetical protein
MPRLPKLPKLPRPRLPEKLKNIILNFAAAYKSFQARLPERFYRDIWLVIITALLTFALIRITENVEDIDKVSKSARANGNAAARQFCNAHAALHQGKEIELDTEQANLENIEEFLNGPRSRVEAPQLFNYLQGNVVIRQQTITAVEEQLAAVVPPPICGPEFRGD